jgi:hypothetical protein
MIVETRSENNNSQKAMVSKFTKRARLSNVQRRARAIQVRHKKLNKTARKRKALRRLAWLRKKRLEEKNQKA